MFSAEIWNQIESQWGREIKKGCSRWRELQSRRLSYHQLIEWNPPTSFPSRLFSQTMLGSNLVVWNHKNLMWKIPCSWHAVVRNFHVQIHLQQGPAFRQNYSLPNVTVKSNRSYRNLSLHSGEHSISRLLHTSWKLLLIPERAGSCHRMGAALWAESTIQGEDLVDLLWGSSCTASLLWGHANVDGTSHTMLWYEMQSADTSIK